MIKFIGTKLCKCGRNMMVKLDPQGKFFVAKYFTDKEICGTCFTFGLEESKRQLGKLGEQLTK